MIPFGTEKALDDDRQARKLLLHRSLFAILNSVLYKIDPKNALNRWWFPTDV